MRTSHTSRFPFMGSFHDAERLLRPFGLPVDCRFDFPRFHGGVKRLKFRSGPNITNITLRVIYSCRGGVLTIQDIRPRDSTPVFQSSPAPFFFQASSLDLSLHRITQIEAFVPILALLWNPGMNWLVPRWDAIAKKGDTGVEGRKGCRARHER
jgi:hypothetical protein